MTHTINNDGKILSQSVDDVTMPIDSKIEQLDPDQ